MVFTELAAYSSSPVVRERFVSSEARESPTSPQNYRYSKGAVMHVPVCMYINSTRLPELIFPGYFVFFPLNFEAFLFFFFTIPLISCMCFNVSLNLHAM